MKKYQINLIQQKKKDFADTIIYFFLHYLRYIIVLTQIVVIGVFFFRFQVDQEIIDLKESIDQKQEIVQVTKPLIAEARAIDAKIKVVKKILKSQETFLKNMNYVFATIPQGIVLNKFEINEGAITFTGTTNNIPLIKAFSETLKKSGTFKMVTMTDLIKGAGGYSFSVLATSK